MRYALTVNLGGGAWKKGTHIGEEDFVEWILKQTDERLEPTYALKTQGYDFDRIVQRVAELLDIPKQEVVNAGKRRSVVKARSIVGYWAHGKLGINQTDPDRKFVNYNPISVPNKRVS